MKIGIEDDADVETVANQSRKVYVVFVQSDVIVTRLHVALAADCAGPVSLSVLFPQDPMNGMADYVEGIHFVLSDDKQVFLQSSSDAIVT